MNQSFIESQKKLARSVRDSVLYFEPNGVTPACYGYSPIELDTLIEQIIENTNREIIQWCENPKNTPEGLEAKTIDDVIEYLSPKESFKCHMDCGIEQVHTHQGGDIKKVFIRHDLTTPREDNNKEV